MRTLLTIGLALTMLLPATATNNMTNDDNNPLLKASTLAYGAPDFSKIKNSDYLLAGDILLNDAHHTCTVITNGAKASGTVTLPLVKRGSTGAAVEELQEKLNAASYRNKKTLLLRIKL